MKICKRDKSGHSSSLLAELVVKHLQYTTLLVPVCHPTKFLFCTEKILDSQFDLTLDLFSLLLRALQLLHKYFFSTYLWFHEIYIAM